MNETVLIVDDSVSVRTDLADAIHAAGFHPLQCATAAGAREVISRGDASVYILDVGLPDGDGVDLLQEIRRSPSSASAVVVLLSSEAEVQDRIRGLPAGADEYVGKPYDKDYLVERLHELIQTRHGADNRSSVLVIDDSVTFRETLRAAFESTGYSVHVASSGEEGMRVAGAQRPDAIIVDGMLPGIDGPTVIRHIRLDPVLRDVPCLLMTPSGDKWAELRALDAGADTFIRKNEDLGVAKAKLAAALHRRTARPYRGEETRSLLGPKKILAVDDSAAFLAELTGALKGEGYDIIQARSGEEAIKLLAVQSVDCILLAVAMPGLGGHETCRRIKTASILRHVPLIMLGAAGDSGTMIEALGAGADDYIQKSSEFEALNARVRAQIRRKQVEDENRRLREELLRREMEAVEERAARELAETRTKLLEELERTTGRAERLKIDEERTEFALTAARVGIWQRNLVNGETTFSKSLTVLFGIPPSELKGSLDQIFDRIHDDDRATVRAAIDDAARRRGEFSVEFRAAVRDGAIRWLQSRGRTACDDHGKPVRLLGVTIDITERRSLELQLRQSQKMEAVGQLAGGVAHDFNNVLTAILGYGKFLLENLTVESQRQDLEQIIKAANRAASLTHQLLSFSRRQVVETTVLNLNTLIEDIVVMLRRLIGEHIELATVYGPGLLPVRADPGYLEQVIVNLVVNARDAMSHGGIIRLQTTNTVIDESRSPGTVDIPPGAYVRLSVIDTGCGMTEQTKARLFEPFFTTKERSKGTGLGLATVYGIVKQSGGFITVQSELHRGSTFEIYLPHVREAVAPAAKTVPPLHASGHDEAVLLVEDEPVVRELTRLILERAGFRVVETSNATEARQAFGGPGAHFDLLLTDVVMPGGTGPDLFASLSKDNPDLRVLFISGYTDTAVFDLAVLDREVGFLGKPFTAEGLVRKVREILDR